MKHLLNTLYVLTPKSYLALEGETVAIRQQGASRRIPLHTLDSIVAFGNVACSPALMFACAERDVTLSFLAMSGRFQARAGLRERAPAARTVSAGG